MSSSIPTALNTIALRSKCPPDCIASRRESIALPARALLRIEPGKEADRLSCSFGSLWVTVEGSSTDTILQAGQSMDLPRKGLMVVEALKDSAVEIG